MSKGREVMRARFDDPNDECRNNEYRELMITFRCLKSLVAAFDKKGRELGYKSRSEHIRELIRYEIAHTEL